MYGEISYKEIEEGSLKGSTVLVDVRTREEFLESTIPNSINIPIMTEDERAEIGRIYVQEDVKKAKRLGIKVGSQKLPQIYLDIENLYNQYDNVVIFCARGGYRSKSVFYIMKSMGFNIYKLKGGYKEYRKYINENLPMIIDRARFVVLSGKTGCGKTKILKKLEDMGKLVLDLEGYANHRGSLLGDVGLGSQNSQKMFESLVYHKLKSDQDGIFFTEGESKRIGRIVMPEYMYKKISSSKTILIDSPIEHRVKNILEDYVNNTDKELIERLGLLTNHISKRKIDGMIEDINYGDYQKVIRELMENYYDINYNLPSEYDYEIMNFNEEETAKRILEIIDC